MVEVLADRRLLDINIAQVNHVIRCLEPGYIRYFKYSKRLQIFKMIANVLEIMKVQHKELHTTCSWKTCKHIAHTERFQDF